MIQGCHPMNPQFLYTIHVTNRNILYNKNKRLVKSVLYKLLEATTKAERAKIN